MTDPELSSKAADTAEQLVSMLHTLSGSATPALARTAQAELYWASVMARRLRQLAALAAREDQTAGIEAIIAASHHFGEQG